MKDPYSILGVSPDASEEDVKKAYKKLALEWHPDRHQGDKKAEERFKEISEAFNMIKEGKAHPSPEFGFNPFASFSDLFNQAFGAPFRRQQRRMKMTKMQISIEEAHIGCQKKIRINEIHACTDCKGIGFELSDQVCSTCGGSGQIRSAVGAGNIHIARSCPACQGLGRMKGKRCGTCSGKGKVEKTQEMMVNVPSGILPGQKIYPQSDLEITVLYSSHPHFKLIDSNTGQIASNVVINMFEAMLGGNIDIDTLNGKKSLKVNAGTQPNSILRIKNGGVGGRADHLVNIEVTLLENLTNEQIELLQRLKQTQENS